MAGERVAIRTGRPLEANVRVSTEDTVVFELKLSTLEEMPVAIDGQPVRGRIAWVNVTDEGDRLIIGMALNHDADDREGENYPPYDAPVSGEHSTTKLLFTSEPPRPPLPPFPPAPVNPPEGETGTEQVRIPTGGIVILTPPDSERRSEVRKSSRRPGTSKWPHVLAFMLGLLLSVGITVGYLVRHRAPAGKISRPKATVQDGSAKAGMTADRSSPEPADTAVNNMSEIAQGSDSSRNTEQEAENANRNENRKAESPAAPAAVNSGTPVDDTETDSLLVTRHGRTVRVIVPLSGLPEGFSHYILKAPWGVVVNVKADTSAKSVVPATPGVRRIKVLKMSRGSRFIVYTRSRPKNVHIRTTSRTLTLTFTL